MNCFLRAVVLPAAIVFLLLGLSFSTLVFHPETGLPIKIEERAPPGDDPDITWTNVSGSTNLWNWGGNFFSWADFDSDGDQDLLVDGSLLLVNSGAPNYTFSDQTAAHGIIGGHNTGSWGDIDNDGDLDLALGGTSADTILLNSGSPSYTFSNAAILEISNTAPTQGMSLRDWDGDGFLDLYVMNGENWNNGNPIYYRDFFYVNDQQGGFNNRSDLITAEQYYGRGISWGDYDRDFDSDLYVGNYRIVPNRFYENRAHPTTGTQELWERTSDSNDPSHVLEGERRYYQSSGPYWGHTIGSAFGDMNNDGFPEIITANLVHLYYDSSDIRGLICDDSHFYTQDPIAGVEWHDYRPDSGISFKPRGGSGTYQGDELYSGVALGDVDNDGDLDMWLPQIYDLSYAKAELWVNNGDLRFSKSSDPLLQVINTYGGTFVDYDNDGDLDLLTGGQDGVGQANRMHLFRNDGPSGESNKWLDVVVEGEGGAPAVGAAVEVWHNGSPIQYREVAGAEGPSASGAPLRTHFGLGGISGEVTLLVTWPDRTMRWVENVTLGQAVAVSHPTVSSPPPSLSLVSSPSTVNEGDIALLEVSITEGLEVWVDAGADGLYEVKNGSWDSSNTTIPIFFENQGERVVRLLAFDALTGEGRVSSLKVDVLAVAPLARVEHPQYILPGEFVTFDAGSTDDAVWDRDHMSYRWEWDDGLFRDYSPTTTYTRSFDSPGMYNLTMTARDEQGLTDIYSEEVVVAAPIPDGIVTAPSDASMDSPANFAFTLNSSHPNPENVTYRFDWGDGSVRDWTTSANAAHTWTSPGQFMVNISVKNQWGEVSDFLHQVIISNAAPYIYWTTTTEQTLVGDRVVFQVQVGDTLSDQELLQLEWGLDGVVLTGEQGLTLETELWATGVHTVTAQVRDPHGAVASVNSTVIVNSLDEAELELVVVDGFLVGDTVYFSVQTRLLWQVSDGVDWQVMEQTGLDEDGHIQSESGIVFDLWSESRQERIYREMATSKMTLVEPSLLRPCQSYRPAIENLPQGAGIALRWQTSFGWMETVELHSTNTPKAVEVTVLLDNQSAVVIGSTAAYFQSGPTTSVAEVESTYGECSKFYRLGGGEYVNSTEMESQLANLTAGTYNVGYLIEDEGHYNMGGSFTYYVEGGGGGELGEMADEGTPSLSLILVAIVAAIVVLGGAVAITLLFIRRTHRDDGSL